MKLQLNDPSGIVKIEQVNADQIHVIIDEKRFLDLPYQDRSEFSTQIFCALSQGSMSGWQSTYLDDCFDFTITRKVQP